MALPTSLCAVQDSRVALGPELCCESFLVNPGYADYETGGYLIAVNGYTETAAQMAAHPSPSAVPFKSIQSVVLAGCNSTAMGWNGYPVLPLAQIGGSQLVTGGNGQWSGKGASGYSYFNFKAMIVTSGIEASALADLSGAIWVITIFGY